jgi:poly(3-hydroxyalkanoate) synthetase
MNAPPRRVLVAALVERRSADQLLLHQPGRHAAGDRVARWKPAARLADTGFDDYLTEGVNEAVRVARAVSGAEKVHAVGYCTGGTLLAAYMAWLAQRHPEPERMPHRMHEFYLRAMYLRNDLVKPNALTLAGEPIDLARIHVPLYQVATEDDHIAPRRQTFRINGWVTGHKRFVLSSSGHILGIVNPPVTPPKRHFRVGPAHRGQTADAWHATAGHRDGSWRARHPAAARHRRLSQARGGARDLRARALIIPSPAWSTMLVPCLGETHHGRLRESGISRIR